MKTKTIIFLDRDGTLIYDDEYHLGRQRKWKDLIKILPGVEGGLRQLNMIPNSVKYIATNQPGVGILQYTDLTEKKTKEVTKYIMDLLNKKQARIKGFFVCPHIYLAYAKSHPQITPIKKYAMRCNCAKPKPGMLLKGIKKERLNPNKDKFRVYMIGDRSTDVLAALNAGGTGILVPFIKTPGQIEKTKKLQKIKKYNGRIYIAKSFHDAVKFILKRENESSK